MGTIYYLIVQYFPGGSSWLDRSLSWSTEWWPLISSDSSPSTSFLSRDSRKVKQIDRQRVFFFQSGIFVLSAYYVMFLSYDHSNNTTNTNINKIYVEEKPAHVNSVYVITRDGHRLSLAKFYNGQNESKYIAKRIINFINDHGLSRNGRDFAF